MNKNTLSHFESLRAAADYTTIGVFPAQFQIGCRSVLSFFPVRYTLHVAADMPTELEEVRGHLIK